MSKQTDYTDEHLQIGERVKDFLPSASKLIKREGETLEITIESTMRVVDKDKYKATFLYMLLNHIKSCSNCRSR